MCPRSINGKSSWGWGRGKVPSQFLLMNMHIFSRRMKIYISSTYSLDISTPYCSAWYFTFVPLSLLTRIYCNFYYYYIIYLSFFVQIFNTLVLEWGLFWCKLLTITKIVWPLELHFHFHILIQSCISIYPTLACRNYYDVNGHAVFLCPDDNHISQKLLWQSQILAFHNRVSTFIFLPSLY